MPPGVLGTLTGRVAAFIDKFEMGSNVPIPLFDAAGEEAQKQLGLDAPRLKWFMAHPEEFGALRSKPPDMMYWEAVKAFSGEKLMACYIQVEVTWDMFAVRPDSYQTATYVPLLELSDSPPCRPTVVDRISFYVRRIFRRFVPRW
jgi:hypothetical protein